MTKKIVLDSFPRHLKLCLRRSCNSSHGIATRQQCSGCWVWQHTLHIKHRKTHIYQAHQTLKGANLVVDPFFHSADHFLWYCMLKTDFNLFISPSIIDTSSKNFFEMRIGRFPFGVQESRESSLDRWKPSAGLNKWHTTRWGYCCQCTHSKLLLLYTAF